VPCAEKSVSDVQSQLRTEVLGVQGMPTGGVIDQPFKHCVAIVVFKECQILVLIPRTVMSCDDAYLLNPGCRFEADIRGNFTVIAITILQRRQPEIIGFNGKVSADII
jgi:hypothetical protein